MTHYEEILAALKEKHNTDIELTDDIKSLMNYLSHISFARGYLAKGTKDMKPTLVQVVMPKGGVWHLYIQFGELENNFPDEIDSECLTMKCECPSKGAVKWIKGIWENTPVEWIDAVSGKASFEPPSQ